MTYCGIDFGTSNSAIAIEKNGVITLAPVEDSAQTLPSAMFFPRGARPLYGRTAQQTFFDGHEGRFMRSLKRMLGTELMNFGTLVNDRPRRFDELIGGFIGHLKAAGEATAGCELDRVVIGRPVHFVDGDAGADYAAEEQLKLIALAAGFKHIAFQFEPIAAAFAHEQKLDSETLALVADIGGGTSDFTVIRIGGARSHKADRSGDILGNSGIRTGGNDFDKSLSLHSFMPALGYGATYGARNLHFPRAPFHDLSEWSKVNFVYAPKTVAELRDTCDEAHDRPAAARLMHVLEDELGHRLLSSVEDSKIALSDADLSHADLGFVQGGFGIDVSHDAFLAAVHSHIDDITQSLDECLTQADVGAHDIELCILTGGPTAMPALAQAILSRLPNARVSDDNKLSSVATGLGHAARSFAAVTS